MRGSKEVEEERGRGRGGRKKGGMKRRTKERRNGVEDGEEDERNEE